MESFISKQIVPSLKLLEAFRCSESGGFCRKRGGENATVVNTTEAICLLRVAPHYYGDQVEVGARFIEGKLNKYLGSNKVEQKRRIRYFAFGTRGLLAADYPREHQIIKASVDHLLRLQRDDGGWAHGDNAGSSLSASCFVLEALKPFRDLEVVRQAFTRGEEYLSSIKWKAGLWKIPSAKESSSPALATAMSLTLIEQRAHIVDNYRYGQAYLRRVGRVVSKHPIVYEKADNTTWAHPVPLWLARFGLEMEDMEVCRNALRGIKRMRPEGGKQLPDTCDYFCNSLQCLVEMNTRWNPYSFIPPQRFKFKHLPGNGRAWLTVTLWAVRISLAYRFHHLQKGGP